MVLLPGYRLPAPAERPRDVRGPVTMDENDTPRGDEDDASRGRRLLLPREGGVRRGAGGRAEADEAGGRGRAGRCGAPRRWWAGVEVKNDGRRRGGSGGGTPASPMAGCNDVSSEPGSGNAGSRRQQIGRCGPDRSLALVASSWAIGLLPLAHPVRERVQLEVEPFDFQLDLPDPPRSLVVANYRRR
jgi:hypothetical protein